MPRATSQEIDAEIIEAAAALIAQHGYEQTSLQRIADAVGYSKTGLLHRFPSKEALLEAVATSCTAAVDEVHAAVRDLPPGPARDVQVVRRFVEMAVGRPGYVCLVLALCTTLAGTAAGQRMSDVPERFFAAFATDPDAPLLRRLQVLAALGSLAVTAMAPLEEPPERLRPLVTATTLAALGHPAADPDPDPAADAAGSR
ncbi:helix-turn-helix domain-containing protein [Kineococcus glutinatus]|uniref:HTH tetR-type domain-containing protein n=1 Tax=Kineococcus glutinatus TaxID=1070872 RepID=A0ABP9I7T4_9ACTN